MDKEEGMEEEGARMIKQHRINESEGKRERERKGTKGVRREADEENRNSKGRVRIREEKQKE